MVFCTSSSSSTAAAAVLVWLLREVVSPGIACRLGWEWVSINCEVDCDCDRVRLALCSKAVDFLSA